MEKIYLVEHYDYEMRNENPIPVTKLFKNKQDAKDYFFAQVKTIPSETKTLKHEDENGTSYVVINWPEDKDDEITDIIYFREMVIS